MFLFTFFAVRGLIGDGMMDKVGLSGSECMG
jgi:hypothetical protein